MLRLLIIGIVFGAQLCQAEETLISTAHYPTREVVPYILNYKNLSPRYVIILFPGGSGAVNPRMEEDGIAYNQKGNFLLRSRPYIVDDEFVTIVTDTSPFKERIQAILDDIKVRFPNAQIYLMGTSNGTFDTMALAEYLADKIAGEIHTSSLKRIEFFDARKYKNRHLVVHHNYDECLATPLSSAESSHNKYGNELIVMEGGNSRGGNQCQAFTHHGFKGIEKETITAIKLWIKRGEANMR